MAQTQNIIQQLSALVEWFLTDRQVELRFVHNKHGKGKVAPEWDFEYWIDGRRITDKALALLILTELLRRNYAFNIARCIAALSEHSWRNYIANCEYPDWMRDNTNYEAVQPVGRPRSLPIPYSSPKDAKDKFVAQTCKALRAEGKSLREISGELKDLGYLTRRQNPLSSTQVSRYLNMITDTP